MEYQDAPGVRGPDLKHNYYKTENDSDLDSNSDASNLESDNLELNIRPDSAQWTDSKFCLSLRKCGAHGSETKSTANCKIEGKWQTFVIPEEAIWRDIVVCGCHGSPKVGGLVELPHKWGYPARDCFFKSVKVVKKCDLKKDFYYLDQSIEFFPLDGN